MPRRSRSRAAVIEAPADRGLAMRLLMHSPKDLVAGLAAFAAVSAIITNAIFMQAGRHPSPMFGSTVVIPLSNPVIANPLPRPRPIEAAARSTFDSKLLEGKAVELKAATPKVDPKPVDMMAALVKGGVSPASAAPPRPPASVPVASRSDPVGDLIASSRRVAAVQRALTEYGYAQLKPTGNVGSETQAAIQKFERERKLPVTGQMSDRLVRELTAVTGRPID